jgi:hypothetical protein
MILKKHKKHNMNPLLKRIQPSYKVEISINTAIKRHPKSQTKFLFYTTISKRFGDYPKLKQIKE